MYSRTKYRVLAVISILLILAVSPLGVAQHKSKKQLQQSGVPHGTPVLWQEPSDIATRDLYWGHGGKEMQPDLRRVTLIKKETGGYSTKYRVKDASGHEWVAKLGKEAQSETAATRLMWAVGYFSDVDYLIPSVRIEGLKKTFTNVRFSARPKGVKRIDGWKWDDNPFIGKPEFKGLKVMMVLLNNFDIKDSNNKILVLQNDHGEAELKYFVADLGGTFGKVYGMPKIFRSFIFKPDRNNPNAYAKTHMIDKVKDGRIRFHFSGKRSNLFKNITVEDAEWIASRLSQLSDRQIEDAFRAANYSPEEIRKLTQGLHERIKELVELPKVLTAQNENCINVKLIVGMIAPE
jgi:hypothetical protein